LPTMTQAGQTNYSAQNRKTAVDLINQTFKELKGIFTAWAVAIKDPDIEAETRRQWLKGFIENGIDSDTKINIGLSVCRKHDSPFLPSVGQFIFWCNDAINANNGIPTESEARLAMLRELSKSPDIRAWEQYHPAVRWAYSQRQSSDWKILSAKDLTSAFHEIWLIALKMAKDNCEFSVQIPKSRQIAPIDLPPAPKEVAVAEAARLLSMFSEPEQPKQLTPAEIKDLQRLERLRNE